MSSAIIFLRVTKDSFHRPNRRVYNPLKVEILGTSVLIHIPDSDRKITLSVDEIKKIIGTADVLSKK